MIAGAPMWWPEPLPRYWPAENAEHREGRPVRRWRVLHACDAAGTSSTLAEAQSLAGMRPSVLTPRGWYRPGEAPCEPATPLSLIHEWQQVRQWRTRLALEMADDWAEILHPHCFAAAMAGLRGGSPVVYDLAAAVGAGVKPKPGAWLLRSLRVAEQFVLSRAAAVVVHSQAMWSEALRRGVALEDLFLVPHPVEAAEQGGPERRNHRPAVTIFAPGTGGQDAAVLLRALATLASEIAHVRLLLEVPARERATVLAQAAKLGVAEAIQMTEPEQHAEAMAVAEIIVAGPPADDEPNAVVISALAHGKGILAADVAQNREVTPQGRGCLWYRPLDCRDLAGRAAFLARNPDFCSALGASGRAHLQATRSPRLIAQKYDEVYRHAFERRHRGNLDPMGQLETVRACF